MRLFLIIIGFLLFVSCESEIDYDHSDFEKSIVVNSLLSTENNLGVQLSWSKSIFDNSDFMQIDSADVVMQNLENGRIYRLDQNEEGIYTSNIIPEEGFSYGLAVDVTGHERVTAMTQIPHNLDAEVFVERLGTEDNFEGFEIAIEIEDDPSEDNFYIYEVVKKTVACDSKPETNNPEEQETKPEEEGEETEEGEEEEQEPEVDVEPTNEIINASSIQGYTNETQFNSKNLNETSFISDRDDNFSDNKFTASISLSREEIENDNENKNISSILSSGEECEGERIQYAVKIMTVSPDLFDYLKSVDLSTQQQRPNTSASVPVNIESNIINGLGIFGGINVQIFPID